MGAFWQYFSFEPRRWDALFDGSMPDAPRRIVASAWWDQVEAELPDPEADAPAYLEALYRLAPPEVTGLAERLCSSRFDAATLTADEARRLDGWIPGFFCAEGLEALLDLRIEHRDGLAAAAVKELLERGAATKAGGFLGFGARESPALTLRLAPFLATGRRLGTEVAPHSFDKAFVLRPEEAGVLLAEVDALRAVDRPWKTDEFRAAVDAELRAGLARAAGEGRCFAGRYT